MCLLTQEINYMSSWHDRFAVIWLCILFGLGIPCNAESAEPVQLSVTWNYADNVAGVAGFRLYSMDSLICETSDPVAREMTCPVVVQNHLMPFAMTVYDASGLESASSDLFWVDFDQGNSTVDMAPVAYITASPVYGMAPLQVHFDGSKSLDPDGTIASYVWDFSDGDQAAVISTNHTFMVPGVYAVALVVTDDKGNTAQAESLVTVIAVPGKSVGQLPPTAIISAQVHAVDGVGSVRVNFDASGSTDADGTISRYRWDFGDGETGEGVFVSHTYGEFADYTVTLVVVDNNGATGQTRYKNVLSVLSVQGSPVQGSPVQASSVAQENGASAGGGGGGCSVRRHGGEGAGVVDWLLSLLFVTAVPFVTRVSKSTGNDQHSW